MLLIGSRALALRDPTFTMDDDKDWDIICRENEKSLFSDLPRFEWHDINHLNNDVFNFLSSDDLFKLPNGQIIWVASLNDLAIIKRSHLWRDYQWDKHITHYHKHLAKYLCEDVLSKLLLEDRTKLTKKAYPQGNPNLNQSNEEFFDDAVAKIYDHDYLHELVAYYSEPLYTKLKHDDSKAWCEKDLWDALPAEDKTKCVAEECYVIAMERFLIRNNWECSYKGAYYQAVKKVCTTLTSGWFRDHAIDHFPEVMNLFDRDKLNQLKGQLQ